MTSEQTAAQTNGQDETNLETAIFAAGCFWGVEMEYRNVPGVRATRVGYTGGSADHPSYEQVCSGGTGHAEAVEVRFDPELVSYDQLLDVFWRSHDPTTLNRQGPDVGTQYRSAIFFSTPEQEQLARASKERAHQGLGKQIMTEITPASEFWPAEEYHQCYLEKRGLATSSI